MKVAYELSWDSKFELTAVKNFLSLWVVSTERAVEFESVDIAREYFWDFEEDGFKAADFRQGEQVVGTEGSLKLLEKLLLET